MVSVTELRIISGSRTKLQYRNLSTPMAFARVDFYDIHTSMLSRVVAASGVDFPSVFLGVLFFG